MSDEELREADEWLRLFASRDEVVEWYAQTLALLSAGWPGWPNVNAAIVKRWSLAGLRYIKTEAWKRPKEKMTCRWCNAVLACGEDTLA